MSKKFVDLSQAFEIRAYPWANLNFSTWRRGRAMDWHAHPYLQSIHVLKGSLQVDFGSGWIRLGPEEVHVLPPGFSHRLWTDTGHHQFGVNFSEDGDERGMLSALLDSFPKPVVRPMRFASTWWNGLREFPKKRNPAGYLRMLNLLDEYGIGLLEHSRKHPLDPLSKRLLVLLNRNPDRALGVEQMAKLLNTSRPSLQRTCRRDFGCGAAHLHERLRLERGAQILLEPDKSVTECAGACGYADIFHFSKAFKRIFGMAPSTYRKKMRHGLG